MLRTYYQSAASLMAICIFGVSLSRASTLQHNYSHVLGLSFRFYEAQMSGEVPTWSRASQAQGGWRNRSHTRDGMGPGGVGVSLAGGWYDAGDHLKLSLPLGVSVSLLAYGALTWEASYRKAGQWEIAVRNLDWAASYLIRCHVNASDTPADNTFVAQVGDGDTDHELYWGRPEQQPESGEEGSPGWRPVYVLTAEGGKGADLVAEAVAGMVGTALVLRRPGPASNVVKSDELLRRARQLFEFAKLLPGMWTPPAGKQALYGSTRWRDDMAWAAAWLCRAAIETGVGGCAGSATGAAACAEAASLWVDAAVGGSSGADDGGEYYREAISWASVFPLASLLLRDAGAGGLAMVGRYEDHIGWVLDMWMAPGGSSPDSPLRCNGSSPEFQVCYTPGGLAWYTDLGSARCAANVAMAALLAATTTTTTTSLELSSLSQSRRCWAWRQAGYLLGGNTAKQSYVVGYVPTPLHTSPTRPAHESSSCDPNYAVTCDWSALNSSGPNPSVLFGALVGGPDQLDGYADDRTDFDKNEVSIEYNAGFTGVMAGLLEVESLLAAAGCSWEGYCGGQCGTTADGGVFPPPALCPVEAGQEPVCGAPAPPPPSPPPQPPSPPPEPPAPPPTAPSNPPPSPRPPPPSPPEPSPPAEPPSPPSPPDVFPSDPAGAPSTCRPYDKACRACTENTAVANASTCGACVAVLRYLGRNPYVCHECASYGAALPEVQEVCMSECVPAAITKGTSWACSLICANVRNVGTEPELARQCAACVTATTDGWACARCIEATRCLSDWRDARQQCFDCVAAGVDAVSCAECARLPTPQQRTACLGCGGVRTSPSVNSVGSFTVSSSG